MTLSRREAVARLAVITGTAVIGAEFFISGCARTDKGGIVPFTPADIALLDEIGDTIIPVTDTPGAKAVGIGAFMTMMAHDCYDEATERVFHDGLARVDAAARKRFREGFVTCASDQRTALLNDLDREQRDYGRRRKPGTPAHYFRLMKDLTLLGYFTSEVGCTHALRYAETPGAYDGDVPYRKGDRAWVNPSHRVG